MRVTQLVPPGSITCHKSGLSPRDRNLVPSHSPAHKLVAALGATKFTCKREQMLLLYSTPLPTAHIWLTREIEVLGFQLSQQQGLARNVHARTSNYQRNSGDLCLHPNLSRPLDLHVIAAAHPYHKQINIWRLQHNKIQVKTALVDPFKVNPVKTQNSIQLPIDQIQNPFDLICRLPL